MRLVWHKHPAGFLGARTQIVWPCDGRPLLGQLSCVAGLPCRRFQKCIWLLWSVSYCENWGGVRKSHPQHSTDVLEEALGSVMETALGWRQDWV